MAELKSIAEIVWRKHNPNPNPQTSTKLAEYIETAKTEYAYQMWVMAKQEKASEGEYEIPSVLLRRGEIVIENGEADLSGFNIFYSLANGTWIQNLGGINSECRYVRHSHNMNILLSEDDIGNSVVYIPSGKKLNFPSITGKKTIPFYYASNGLDLDDTIEIDDVLGGVLLHALDNFYGKPTPTDVTVNSNPND